MLCFAISKLILFDEKFEIPPFFAHFNKIFLKFLSLPCSITRPFHQGHSERVLPDFAASFSINSNLSINLFTEPSAQVPAALSKT